jgi:hypothetical protein
VNRVKPAQSSGENAVDGDACDGVRLAPGVEVMPSRLVRIIAVSLIVLGVSPFTAPFSTCDWVTLSGHHQSDRPSDDQTAHGALLKTSTDPDNAPVLAAAAALTTPFFSLVPNDSAVRVPRVSSQRVPLQSLRI